MTAFSWVRGRRSATPLPTDPKRKPRWSDRRAMNFALTLMIIVLIGVVLFPHMVITVPTGHAGVLWKRIYGFQFYSWQWGRGTVLDPREIRQEGLHLIWPWDVLYMYDLRLQTHSAPYNAISKDGVSLTATITIRFQLQNPTLGVFHKFVGPGYLANVIQPEIASQTREVISQYDAEQVYAEKRPEVQRLIRERVEQKLKERLDALVQADTSEFRDAKRFRLMDSVIILDTLVQGIELPPAIVAAINRKVEQYYAVQEFGFRVEREKKEAQRKAIEAEGIAAFQKTVVEGISESYLRWRGIEATLELSRSPNSKVVIIGSNKDGLPIILGNADAAPAAAPAAAPTTPTTPSDGTPPKAESAPAPTPSGTDPTTPGGSTPTTPGGTTPTTPPAAGKGGAKAAPSQPSGGTGTPAAAPTTGAAPAGKQPAGGAKSSKSKSDQPGTTAPSGSAARTWFDRLFGSSDAGTPTTTAEAPKEASKAAR